MGNPKIDWNEDALALAGVSQPAAEMVGGAPKRFRSLFPNLELPVVVVVVAFVAAAAGKINGAPLNGDVDDPVLLC